MKSKQTFGTNVTSQLEIQHKTRPSPLTIFESKIAQLWAFVKSTSFTLPWRQKPGKTRVIPWLKPGKKTGVSWFVNQTYQAWTLCAKSLVNPGIPGKFGNPGLANNQGYQGITRLPDVLVNRANPGKSGNPGSVNNQGYQGLIRL